MDRPMCGSRLAIHDGEAHAEALCTRPPWHAGDHTSVLGLRWQRLDQQWGRPLPDDAPAQPPAWLN
jgi:hypothetical protein